MLVEKGQRQGKLCRLDWCVPAPSPQVAPQCTPAISRTVAGFVRCNSGYRFRPSTQTQLHAPVLAVPGSRQKQKNWVLA
jgi:hypothetical protein